MDYRVDWSALQRAAGRLDALSSDASSAVRTMRLDQVSGALPGSLSAGRASALDGELRASAEQLIQRLARHTRAMEDTARAYEQREEQAQQQIESFFGAIR